MRAQQCNNDAVGTACRSTLEACCYEAAAAEQKTQGFGAAVTDPHTALLDKIVSVRGEIKKRERGLRDAKRAVENIKDHIVDADMDEREAAGRVDEAEAAVEAERRLLQACLREHRENIAHISRLAALHFPELPILMKQRDQTSYLAELFTHEPEVAALFAPERERSHYSDIKPLSRTPDSRHDVDRASFDGTDVALKKYNLNREESLKTLRQELAVLSRLHHPNIISVRLFLVEEAAVAYVEFPLYECDMEAWLRTAPVYPDVHAAVHDILRAIEHMHRAFLTPLPSPRSLCLIPCLLLDLCTPLLRLSSSSLMSVAMSFWIHSCLF